MNANELADVLENDDRLWFVNENLMVKICAMLRQQQEKLTKYELRHVAQRDRIAILEMQHKQQQAEIEALKAKTLTDEEIEEVFRTVEQDFALTESKKSDGGWRNFPVELGRAILRKAQQK